MKAFPLILWMELNIFMTFTNFGLIFAQEAFLKFTWSCSLIKLTLPTLRNYAAAAESQLGLQPGESSDSSRPVSEHHTEVKPELLSDVADW